MVDDVANRKFTEFVGAAGILAHYVGGACQPLHISRSHDGDPENTASVHSDCEDTTLDRYAQQIVNGINTALPGVYSALSASTGSTRMARRAGT